MELNLEAKKQEFLTICRASIQREGIEDLLDWLCKADFFTAPASTKYHGGYKKPSPHGLGAALLECFQQLEDVSQQFE